MAISKGNDTFPVKANEFLTAVETIASQNIRAVESTNLIEDAFYDYEVNDGKVIEEAIFDIKLGEDDINTNGGAIHE